MKKILVSGVIASMMGCATNPDKIQASSISTLQFKDYTCSQIQGELDRVNNRVSELYKSLDEEATNDAAQMTIGMVLFWPALFFLEGGDGPEAAEFARLKGEREAMEKVAVQKECSIKTATSTQPATPKIQATEKSVWQSVDGI